MDSSSPTKNYSIEDQRTQNVESEVSKLTIIPEFRDWALDCLRKAHDKEVGVRGTVNTSLQTALNEARAQLDKLTGMRLRELINDQEYIKEKDRLKVEIARLKSESEKLDSRANNWLELTEQVFNFATRAQESFINGSLKTKKEIMMSLGSNPTILNGKLSIQPHSWFIPIIENQKSLQQIPATFEPTETLVNKSKTDQFSSVGCTWLPGLGSNQ